ncbi:MAG: hypothetical protein CVT93_10550 [Bacteroidetes bacterium HGW-Bacteroidetes-10]|nr:MAG: hypothetical protein CVT93_10550 [Bacteroidetes bacterium HGW-Bacteroidetes-10]
MKDSHAYFLQPYKGPGSRLTCPACNDKHCFSLYVDENGDYLNEAVGRCNHESSCGYHYTPKQFFTDNPTARPNWKDNFFRLPQTTINSTVKTKIWTITTDIVTNSVNPSIDSDFTLFLSNLLGREKTRKVINDYFVGVTKNRDVIFYQIDKEGRCRTGKIMKYNRETGRRIKDEKIGGRITWVHSILKSSTNPKLRLPDDWTLTQCLFGEHLLKQYPFKNVAIVESEKTALICSSFWNEYIWLATGGKSQLNDRLQVLKGRKVVAFPDVDGYQEWKEKLSKINGLEISVSDILENSASEEDRINHVDIADLLIRQHRRKYIPISPVEEHRDPMKHPTFLKVMELAKFSNAEELAMLIDDLDLEMVGYTKN